jgi:DNA-directed RNA polymerase subunit RPC12/RpoP
MAEVTYFSQECPTCGRSLHVRVEYLGRTLVCQHCRGKLVASDPAMAQRLPSESSLRLLERAEELLGLVEQRKHHPR